VCLNMGYTAKIYQHGYFIRKMNENDESQKKHGFHILRETQISVLDFLFFSTRTILKSRFLKLFDGLVL